MPTDQSPTANETAAPGPAPSPARGPFLSRLGPAGLLAIVWLILPPLGTIALFYNANAIADFLRNEPLGALWYVLGFALLAGVGLLPTYAQSGLGGFALGITIGAPAAILGFGAAALIGYEIGRRASADRVRRLIDERPKWKAVRDALVQDHARDGSPTAPGAPGARSARRAAFWRTLGMVILLRLPPNSPFALMNLVMSSVGVPRWAYFLGTMIGMAPRSTLAVVIGAGIKDAITSDALESATPPWVWYVGIGLTLAIVLVIGAIARRAIDRVTAPKPPAA